MKGAAWTCALLALGCGGDHGEVQTTSGRSVRDGGTGIGRVPEDDEASVPSRRASDAGTRSGGRPTTGGGGGIARGNEDASVYGAETLSELPESERERLCHAQLARFFDADAVAGDCTFEAVFETSSAAACRVRTEACVADARSREQADARAALRGCVADLRDCRYTVADLEGCVAEEVAAWDRITRAYSCDDAGDRSSAREPDLEISEDCLALRASCQSW